MFFTFYRTTNLLNGWKYYGVHVTKNPNDRYLGSGKHLRLAIKKYGKESFQKEVLCYCEDLEEAKEIERLFVSQDKIDRKEEFYIYNVISGGGYPPTFTKETHPRGMKGKKHSAESLEKNSIAHRGTTRKGPRPWRLGIPSWAAGKTAENDPRIKAAVLKRSGENHWTKRGKV